MAQYAPPMISVVMSCYNAERWLHEAINSVLRQTFSDFEFILINDGSSDDTLTILHSYASEDSRIIVVDKKNTGLADSLNIGIQRAKGRWVARVDADDICELNRFQKQVEFVNTEPDVVFVGTGLTTIDYQGAKKNVFSYPADHLTLLQNLISSQKFPPHSSAFYRADIFRSIGGYRGRIRRAEDLDLWLRLSEVGKLACLEEPLVQIRKHPDQISNDEGGQRQLLDSRLAIISYWIRNFGLLDPVDSEQPVFEKFSIWVDARMHSSGIYALENFKVDLKNIIKSQLNFFMVAFWFFNAIIKSPFIFIRLAIACLVGDSLSRRLALEWISISEY